MRILLLLFALIVVVVLARPGRLLWAASEAETVITECQNRTGMGRESCIGFVKRYMNVERCQQYAKLSASECEQKLERIRQSPEFRDPSLGTIKESITKVLPKPTVSEAPKSGGISVFEEAIRSAKQDRVARWQLVQEHTEEVINYIEQRGQGVGSLREMLQTLSLKRQAIVSAYDVVLTTWNSTHDTEAVRVERKKLQETLKDTARYYRDTVLPELRRSLQAIDS